MATHQNKYIPFLLQNENNMKIYCTRYDITKSQLME